jgi:uncharacterized membrane protein
MDAVIRAIVYVCVFVTLEIIYTAIKALIKKHDLRLKGNTQLWVMPLYAFGGVFLLEPVYTMFAENSIILRFFIYGTGILFIEYLAGFIFKKIVGRCPWEYHGKWNIQGLINPPYFPLWGMAGIVFEKLYQFLLVMQ